MVLAAAAAVPLMLLVLRFVARQMIQKVMLQAVVALLLSFLQILQYHLDGMVERVAV